MQPAYFPVSSRRGGSQASRLRLVDSHSFLSQPHHTTTHLCTHRASEDRLRIGWGQPQAWPPNSQPRRQNPCKGWCNSAGIAMHCICIAEHCFPGLAVESNGRATAAAAACHQGLHCMMQAERPCLQEHVPVHCWVAARGLVEGTQGDIPACQAGLAEALPVNPLLPGAWCRAEVPACEQHGIGGQLCRQPEHACIMAHCCCEQSSPASSLSKIYMPCLQDLCWHGLRFGKDPMQVHCLRNSINNHVCMCRMCASITCGFSTDLHTWTGLGAGRMGWCTA